MLYAFVYGLLYVAAVQITPVLFQPTDRIGFDYEIAEFTEKQVIRFERKSNTGAWTDLGLPSTVTGAPLGWTTYTYQPTAAFDAVTTIYFRACNASGCGPASTPFVFMRVTDTLAAPTAAPANVRRIGGTTE